MSDSHLFKLPDVGEGLTEADISSWFVKVGDRVDINDTLVEIETAKSAVELPSPYAGVVLKILAQEGDTVPVGDPIIRIGSAAAAPPAPTSVGPEVVDGVPTETDVVSTAAEAPVGALSAALSADEKPQVLVGPGPKDAAARRRKLGGDRPRTEALSQQVAPERVSVPANNVAELRTNGSANSARATPAVRGLARDLGVDIQDLAVPGGVITREDVEAAASNSVVTTSIPVRRPSDVGADGERETRVPIKGVRKFTAEAMVKSAFTACAALVAANFVHSRD